jgi:predicted aspartyl protease
MIYGVVNLRREAKLPLVVGNTSKQQKVIDTVIDTGFSGFLSLPSSIITALDLPWSASDIVTLGDGSETLFDLIHCKCDLGWAVSRDLCRRIRNGASTRNGITLRLSIAG